MNISQPDGYRDVATPLHTATVARGNIYLLRETCDTYLNGIQAVALVERKHRILIVPLIQESGGGLLLKIRNARGDRVIHAQEFFRQNDFVEDFLERDVSVGWNTEDAALVLSDVPKRQHIM